MAEELEVFPFWPFCHLFHLLHDRDQHRVLTVLVPGEAKSEKEVSIGPKSVRATEETYHLVRGCDPSEPPVGKEWDSKSNTAGADLSHGPARCRLSSASVGRQARPRVLRPAVTDRKTTVQNEPRRKREWTEMKKRKNYGRGGIRTHAPEETGALNQRLRPLGHSTVAWGDGAVVSVSMVLGRLCHWRWGILHLDSRKCLLPLFNITRQTLRVQIDSVVIKVQLHLRDLLKWRHGQTASELINYCPPCVSEFQSARAKWCLDWHAFHCLADGS